MFPNTNNSTLGSSPTTPFSFGKAPLKSQAQFGLPHTFASTGEFGSPTSMLQPSPFVSFNATPLSTRNKLFGQEQNHKSSTSRQSNRTGFSLGTCTSTPSFGQNTFQSTVVVGTPIKFSPATSTDSILINRAPRTVNTRIMCISITEGYDDKSLEELRWEDYQCNRKGPQQQGAFAAPAFAPITSSLFAQVETKPIFTRPASFNSGTTGLGAKQLTQLTAVSKPSPKFEAVSTAATFNFRNTSPQFGTSTAPKLGSAQSVLSTFNTAVTRTAQPATNVFRQGSLPTAEPVSKPHQQPSDTRPPTFIVSQPSTNQLNCKSSTNSCTQPTLPPATNANLHAPQTVFQFQNHPPPPPNVGFGGTTLLSETTTPPRASLGALSNDSTPRVTPQVQLGFSNSYQLLEEFRTTVQLLYEPFPHQDCLSGVTAVSKNVEYSAVSLRNVLANTLPPSSRTGNISKLRVQPMCKRDNPRNKLALVKDIPKNSLMSPKNSLLSPKKLSILRLIDSLSNKGKLNCSVNTNEKGLTKAGEVSEKPALVLSVKNKSSAISKDKGRDSFVAGGQLHQIFLASATKTNRELKLIKLYENEDMRDSSEEDDEDEGDGVHPDDVATNKSSQCLSASKTILFNDNAGSNVNNNSWSSGDSGKNDKLENSVDVTRTTSEHEPSAGVVAKFVNSRGDGTSATLLSESPVHIEHSAAPSNPCGIKLERPEYYTVPPLSEINKYRDIDGACVIKGFTIGRVGYGNIYFPDQMDVSNLDLDEIVHIQFREVTLYPDDTKRPPVGQGLNRPAQVTLDNIWPRDRNTHQILKDPEVIAKEKFIDRLFLLSKKQNASFLDYRPDTGSWVFTVKHFSTYRFVLRNGKTFHALEQYRKK